MIARGIVTLFCALAMPAVAAEGGHPVTLWQLQGQHNVVYLLGSIHMLRPQDHPLPGVIDEAYREAEVLVMELDMDDMDPAATQAAFNRAGLMTDGRSLRDLMGETAYAEAERLAAEIDVPLDMLAQAEPWLAAMTIEMMLLYRVGFNPFLGIEMTMTTRAGTDGKPILGLESVEEQLSFLDRLSPEAQRDMLLSTLRQGATLEDTIDDLILAWREGDTEALEDGLVSSIASQEELNRALVVDRNRRWVTRILDLLDDDDDYLVVVGAMHLVGDEGVPRLLEDRGTHIRQLSEPEPLR
ncbi:MAG TPA: TraB/GumN family protein [Woeseiaceae bacterium]